MLGRPSDCRGIGFPFIRNIDIELEFIAVWIEDIEAVGNMVVSRAENFYASTFEFGIGLHEFIIGRANFETNMVETWLGTELFAGYSINFDEEEFVMGTTTREQSHTRLVGGDFMETKGLCIETARSFEVGDVEDDMTEFVDFHTILL